MEPEIASASALRLHGRDLHLCRHFQMVIPGADLSALVGLRVACLHNDNTAVTRSGQHRSILHTEGCAGFKTSNWIELPFYP